MPSYIYLTLLSFFSALNFAFGQCLTPPSQPACTGTETLVKNGDIINNGVTMAFYGNSSAVYNNLRLNGGTLIICDGSLTINAFQIDSGKIFVNHNAQLIIRGSNTGSGAIQLKGNTGIYNRGTLSFKNILSFENTYASASKPIVMINATSDAKLSVDNNWFIINTPHGKFVNKGYFTTHGIITDALASPGCICLDNSITEMTELHNKVPNAYTTPTGSTSCVLVKTRSFPTDTLTSSNSIKLGLSNGHNTFTSKPSPWGSAEVFNNVSTCAAIFTVLPVLFKKFEIEQSKQSNRLIWEIDRTTSTNFYFVVERSHDGRNFSSLKNIYPLSGSVNFLFDDPALYGTVYYRIKVVDESTGKFAYSKVQMINNNREPNIFAYPNPFTETLTITLPKTIQGKIVNTLLDINGKEVFRNSMHINGNTLQLNLPGSLKEGLYVLKTEINNELHIQKLMKKD